MYLGFDTSNYTTSVATYDGFRVKQAKQVLSVKQGEKGLRQSDAVFQHTVNMPKLINLIDEYKELEAVGVSTRPRNTQGSYMPCFLVGINTANAVSKTNNIPQYETSHQIGHILSALYSTKKLELINAPFLAFHLSGGTTEALLVKPDNDEIINAQIIAQSLDLKVGQAIDRTGVMLGLQFPCGKELDRLSLLSNTEFKIKPSMKDFNCSLSGVENKAKMLLSQGKNSEDIAKFVLSYIAETISTMLSRIELKYKNMPVVFSGGVSSNSLLQKTIKENFDAYFPEPEFSLDNAAGCAIYAYLKDRCL